MMKTLIIEDEHKLSNNIVAYLSSEHYVCEQAFKFSDAIEKIDLYAYDCILLDLNLPGGDGLAILDEIKKRNPESGIIIISVRDSLDDKIKGIQRGADDYMSKPFSLAELAVRMYALMRRKRFSNMNILVLNDIEIDFSSKTVKVGGIPVALTKTEYDLLLFLVGNKNKIVSKNAIAEHLSGDMADMMDNHNFVYTHIKNLKAKLSDAGYTNHIKTAYGTGYTWME
jgi:DNA-binding response OmpR family regulator